MDWKKPLTQKIHVNDFLLSVLMSVYKLDAKVELKTDGHSFLASLCVGEDFLRFGK